MKSIKLNKVDTSVWVLFTSIALVNSWWLSIAFEDFSRITAMFAIFAYTMYFFWLFKYLRFMFDTDNILTLYMLGIIIAPSVFGYLTNFIFGELQQGTVPAISYMGLTWYVIEVKALPFVFVSYAITATIFSYFILVVLDAIYAQVIKILPKSIKRRLFGIDKALEEISDRLFSLNSKTLYGELLLGMALMLLNFLIILLILR